MINFSWLRFAFFFFFFFLNGVFLDLRVFLFLVFCLVLDSCGLRLRL
jgi:hypothetical protein